MRQMLGRVLKAVDLVTEGVAESVATNAEHRNIRAAVEVGVYLLRDALKASLDIRDQLPEGDLPKAASDFCFNLCAFGVPEPGGHEMCGGCMLRPFTVDLLTNAAAAAVEDSE